jgi:uncharacterized protein with NAD-binding domain and iron-sulfur cluster
MPVSTHHKRRKIIVLGGGISALTTVFDLTSEKGWKSKYDITLYQLGWRLGGKGASSRNPAFGNRIEEHGLHIWLGFYENAFQIMRACYNELPRNAATFHDWGEAFKPHSFLVLEEKTTDGWLHWPMSFPENDSLPGDGREFPTLWDYFIMALEWLEHAIEDKPEVQVGQDDSISLSSWSAAIMREELSPSESASLRQPVRLLRAAHRRAKSIRRDRRPHTRQPELMPLLNDVSRWLVQAIEGGVYNNPEIRRQYIPIDLMCAVARGVVADGVLIHGLDALDGFEFKEWLSRHGASPVAVDSAFLRGVYDLAFSFENGDSDKPNMAAGVMVRAVFRMVFTYKGAVLWKMQAGMGETIFTPLYLVLKQRGVKFQFFHKVESLELSQDKGTIARVKMTKQATVRSG